MSIGSGVFVPWGSKNRGFPVTRRFALTTVLHYCAGRDHWNYQWFNETISNLSMCNWLFQVTLMTVLMFLNICFRSVVKVVCGKLCMCSTNVIWCRALQCLLNEYIHFCCVIGRNLVWTMLHSARWPQIVLFTFYTWHSSVVRWNTCCLVSVFYSKWY